MNEQLDFEPLDRRDNAWLEGVMSFDARSPHHGDDDHFVDRLMVNLPKQHAVAGVRLMQLFMSGTACSAAAIVVVKNSQALAVAFSQTTIKIDPAQLGAVATSLLLLLGMGYFIFRLQRDL